MRLRSSLLQTWVLPLLLAALAARALMPTGFMAAGTNLGFTVAMCSLDENRSERVEIPGVDPDGEHSPASCVYCLTPLLGMALDSPRVETLAEYLPVFAPAADSQLAALPLSRAQNPRAPPHA